MRKDIRQYLLGLKILGLVSLIGAIVIGALIIFVGPIVMGFFQNPTAAIIALGKAFAVGVAICAVWAFAKYILRGETKGK